ncbi:MAG: FAD-dependent oxidoreductase, partial [Deltaproteobacteria bacterium]|nr:FAD-dependent oxidoreductase [Deltaproteobacteria bacterium]
MAAKLLIIGGVAGGATAAARARRLNEEAEIILFERGEFISFANCGLPYYIGETIKKRNDLLVTTVEFFSRRYNIDIRIFSEVVSIDRIKKEVEVRDHKKGETYRESYDKIILSPGAEPVRPPLEGIDLDHIFSVRTIPDADNIKAFINAENPQSGVVIGGGFIGLEMAEALAERGLRVTIVEMLDQVLAPLDKEMAGIVEAYLKEKGITCVMSDGVKSFSQKSDRLVVSTNNGLEFETDMVILSIGIRPENELA